MKNTTLATVLALSPLLGIYSIGIPLLSLSQILLILFLALCYYKHRGRFESYFIVFIIYAVIITIFNFVITPWTILGDGIHDILSLLLFFFTLLGVINFADYKQFKKVLLGFGIVSVVFFFVQYGLSLAGIGVSGIFPYLPLSNEESTTDMIAHKLEAERNSGLFLEPAHYADFMIIVLLFFLFKEKMTRKDIILSIAIIASIILSHSATGYVVLTIVLAYWVFVYHLSKSKYRFLFLSLALSVVSVLVMYISANEGMMEVFGRYNELTGENASETVHGYSSFIRVMRGYIPFTESDWFHQLFGNGLGSLLGFVKAHPQSNYLALTSFNPNWINGLQYLLFSTGVIGAVIYFTQLFKIGRKTSVLGKAFIVVLIMLFLSADSFFSVEMILYIIVKEKYINRSVVA